MSLPGAAEMLFTARRSITIGITISLRIRDSRATCGTRIRFLPRRRLKGAELRFVIERVVQIDPESTVKFENR